ncbi:MAG: cpaF1 [Herbinix sp.]|jgi:pilus assembly protein CpaF|nr:cpaF1 [Herbinix sp.]
MGFSHSNTIIIALVTASVLIIIYFIFKKDYETNDESDHLDRFSISSLKAGIRELFNEIINQNITALYLNQRESRKREQQKVRLNTALRSCAQGNIGEKEYVKDYIKDLLQNNLGINEITIDRVIPFQQPEYLSTQDKFEILLFLKKKEYRFQALEELVNLCSFDQPKENELGTYYEISKEDIERAFFLYSEPLHYIDKIEIITQRIYQEVYGFSIADELRDMNLDGISGGVSGIATEQYNYMEEVFRSGGVKRPMTYDSLWIFYHGKAIYLSFLSFESASELIRVCKNLYRYDNVGHLTSSNGYKLTYMYDGSRVVVVRPKLTTHWAFFLRKFDSAKYLTFNTLIRDKGNEIVIELIKWAVKGCLNIVLSGDQNSGKTTALKAMMQFIDQRYPIRTTEQEFELWLNNSYPRYNVVCFRGSDEVDLIDSINIQKKTDAAIMILGEVASAELANAFITLTQAGTKSTMCTCHCVTTEDLIDYFRNAVLSSGTFSNEMIAEEQVANSIHLDIHWEKSQDGHRFISYISEIIPFPREELWPKNSMDCIVECLKRMSRKRAFYTRKLIVYEEGEYIMVNNFSERLRKRILKNICEADENAFLAFNSNHS